MKEILDKYIRRFEMLTEQEVQIIKDCTVIKSFSKGTQIVREGQVLLDGYLILEGCIREYFLKDGEEKTTGIYMEGDPVNHYNDGSPSQHYLVCVEDCHVSISNEALVIELIKRIPRITSVIQQGAKETMKKAKEQMSAFMASSPEERYIELIEKRPEVFNRIPQHQIASYLGIKPQSLSRLRSRIQTKGKNN